MKLTDQLVDNKLLLDRVDQAMNGVPPLGDDNRVPLYTSLKEDKERNGLRDSVSSLAPDDIDNLYKQFAKKEKKKKPKHLVPSYGVVKDSTHKRPRSALKTPYGVMACQKRVLEQKAQEKKMNAVKAQPKPSFGSHIKPTHKRERSVTFKDTLNDRVQESGSKPRQVGIKERILSELSPKRKEVMNRQPSREQRTVDRQLNNEITSAMNDMGRLMRLSVQK